MMDQADRLADRFVSTIDNASLTASRWGTEALHRSEGLLATAAQKSGGWLSRMGDRLSAMGVQKQATGGPPTKPG